MRPLLSELTRALNSLRLAGRPPHLQRCRPADPPDRHPRQEDSVNQIIEETQIGVHLYRATYRGTPGEIRTIYEVLDETGLNIAIARSNRIVELGHAQRPHQEAAAYGVHCRAADLDGVCLIGH